VNIKYIAEFTNTEIKNKTEITGFLEVITNKLEITANKANISWAKNVNIIINIELLILSFE
jgi:hypothetical protein